MLRATSISTRMPTSRASRAPRATCPFVLVGRSAMPDGRLLVAGVLCLAGRLTRDVRVLVFWLLMCYFHFQDAPIGDVVHFGQKPRVVHLSTYAGHLAQLVVDESAQRITLIGRQFNVQQLVHIVD